MKGTNEFVYNCLTPLSTVIQLCRGGQFYWMKRSVGRKPSTWQKSLKNLMSYCCLTPN